MVDVSRMLLRPACPSGGSVGPRRAELAALVAERIPPDGKRPWRSMTGTRAGHALMAAAQAPLRAATHPAHDLHVRIDVPYADRTDNGLPTRPALDELRAREDRLYQHADGAVLVAHPTWRRWWQPKRPTPDSQW